MFLIRWMKKQKTAEMAQLILKDNTSRSIKHKNNPGTKAASEKVEFPFTSI